MKVAIVGAGAVGGYYGGALAQAGLDVALICRPGAHLDAVRRDGLLVASHWGDYTVHPNATDDPAAVGPVDLVIYSVKTYHNAQALPLIKPLLGPSTIVLPIQNGTESPANVASVYGWDKVLAGTTYIEAGRPGPGRIEQTGTVARIEFGEQDGSKSPRTEKVASILNQRGIQIEVSANIRRSLWTKLVTVAAVGTSIAAARATLVEYLECPVGEATLREIMTEITAVGRSEGIEFVEGVVDRQLAATLAEAPEVKASLQMDLDAGRPLEIDDLLGAVVRKGRENGVPVPASAALYATLYKFRNGPTQS